MFITPSTMRMTYRQFLQDFRTLEDKLKSHEPSATTFLDLIQSYEDDMREDLEYLDDERKVALEELEDFDEEVPPYLHNTFNRVFTHIMDN